MHFRMQFIFASLSTTHVKKRSNFNSNQIQKLFTVQLRKNKQFVKSEDISPNNLLQLSFPVTNLALDAALVCRILTPERLCERTCQVNALCLSPLPVACPSPEPITSEVDACNRPACGRTKCYRYLQAGIRKATVD